MVAKALAKEEGKGNREGVGNGAESLGRMVGDGLAAKAKGN